MESEQFVVPESNICRTKSFVTGMRWILDKASSTAQASSERDAYARVVYELDATPPHKVCVWPHPKARFFSDSSVNMRESFTTSVYVQERALMLLIDAGFDEAGHLVMWRPGFSGKEAPDLRLHPSKEGWHLAIYETALLAYITSSFTIARKMMRRHALDKGFTDAGLDLSVPHIQEEFERIMAEPAPPSEVEP